jgi:hypothetical protein
MIAMPRLALVFVGASALCGRTHAQDLTCSGLPGLTAVVGLTVLSSSDIAGGPAVVSLNNPSGVANGHGGCSADGTLNQGNQGDQVCGNT